MPSILIVDDNVHLIALMGRMLAPLAQISFATHGAAALQQMLAHRPDLVLLDEEMPGMSGHEVCDAMRGHSDLAAIPVMFVTGHHDADAEVRALTAGAVDFISKPVHEAVLLARVRTQLRLKELSDQLRRSAMSDGLTGLANRGELDRRLTLEMARAARQASTLSVLMLDVDHFKLFNDRYGHPAGDQCLRAVAGVLQAHARRATDLAARFGGEEFALVLPEASISDAQDAAERVRADVLALAIAHAGSSTAPHVTVSIGVASCRPLPDAGEQAVAELISQADRALYGAKALGRNRVCHARTQQPGGANSPLADLLAEPPVAAC